MLKDHRHECFQSKLTWYLFEQQRSSKRRRLKIARLFSSGRDYWVEKALWIANVKKTLVAVHRVSFVFSRHNPEDLLSGFKG